MDRFPSDFIGDAGWDTTHGDATKQLDMLRSWDSHDPTGDDSCWVWCIKRKGASSKLPLNNRENEGTPWDFGRS